MKQMWSKEEINENVKNLYKHSFKIRAYNDDDEDDTQILYIYCDIYLQNKAPLYKGILKPSDWEKLVNIIQNRYAYLCNITGKIFAENDSYAISIDNFITLDLSNTNIMIKCAGVYSTGANTGEFTFIDEIDYVPEEGEEIREYSVYDCNTGEELYFTEI